MAIVNANTEIEVMKVRKGDAMALSGKAAKSHPMRRVFIEKKGKKAKHLLGISCMYDRAMLRRLTRCRRQRQTQSSLASEGDAVRRMPANICSWRSAVIF